MILGSSAVVAILMEEPEAEDLLARLQQPALQILFAGEGADSGFPFLIW